MPACVTPAHQRLQSELQARLGPELAVVCTGVNGDPDSLWPQERAAVSAAIARRQSEFAAGRSAARSAMRQLGHPECAIPAGQDRSPLWPVDLVGSIAHTGSVCVAMLGRRESWTSIGIDIESEQAVAPEIWPTICTRAELQHLHEQDASVQHLAASRLFTAKEAYYKWQFPLTGSMLDFKDVQMDMRQDGFWPARAQRTDPDDPSGCCSGSWLSIDGWVMAWVVTRASQGLPGAAHLYSNPHKPVRQHV